MKSLCCFLLFFCVLSVCSLLAKSFSSPVGDIIGKIEIESDDPVEIVRTIYAKSYPDRVGTAIVTLTERDYRIVPAK